MHASRADDEGRVDRRTFIAGAGAFGLAALGLGAPGLAAGREGAQPACTLTPEATEGPYYVDLERVRRRITEGRAGLPLRLRITVLDTRGCVPLRGAAVDVWHCDALGDYSGVGGESTTFLRGVQLTDARGAATFDTIYPGWYPGRAVHVHLKVHVGGRRSGTRYAGGHVAHTGQLFFPEAMSDKVFAGPPYRRHHGERTRNGDDGIYAGAGGAAAVLRLTPAPARLVGTVTLGVNPTATPRAVGGGGPGGPPPPPSR
jgi:protocatechuate 3,4-dioxygenase beta subunit